MGNKTLFILFIYTKDTDTTYKTYLTLNDYFGSDME